jgi:hypothetical protein
MGEFMKDFLGRCGIFYQEISKVVFEISNFSIHPSKALEKLEEIVCFKKKPA